jgi:hypothetical protein
MGWMRSRCRLQRGPASSLSHRGKEIYLCLKDETPAAEGGSQRGWLKMREGTLGTGPHIHPLTQSQILVVGMSPASCSILKQDTTLVLKHLINSVMA